MMQEPGVLLMAPSNPRKLHDPHDRHGKQKQQYHPPLPHLFWNPGRTALAAADDVIVTTAVTPSEQLSQHTDGSADWLVAVALPVNVMGFMQHFIFCL